jgi:hypothetical protein
MKHIALAVLLLTGMCLSAQEGPKVPELPFHVVDDFFQIPTGNCLLFESDCP